MLASTLAAPQWTYHQWVCLSLAIIVPSSPCRVSLLGTVGVACAHLPLPSGPQPNVTISANHTAPLYAGTGLTLPCTVSLDSSVNTVVNVSVTWTGPMPIPGEQYSVMEASGSGGTYTGSLTISPLAEGQDDGQYTCSVTVSGGSSVSMATGSDAVAIHVAGENFICYCIVRFRIFFALQPSCLLT